MMPLGLLFSFLPKKDDKVDVELTKLKKMVIFPIIAFIIGSYDGFFGPGTVKFTNYSITLYHGIIIVSVIRNIKNI